MPGQTTARVRVGPEPTHLARLAVVFADPLRLKIVSELFRREMSPSQFYAAYGGGSLSRVDRHFKRLAEHGWIRLVQKATGGRRRGGTEHFYRAPELAIFDNETWATLPPSLKGEYSWRTFEQLAERVKAALEANTFDSRPDRHFTWTPFVFDELARRRMIAAVDSLFESLFEEQADAKIRLTASGDEPIHLTVGLAAFDSPKRHRYRSGLRLGRATAAEQEEATQFLVRMARVFGNPLNLKIVTELNMRAMSPSQFVAEVGGAPLSDVYRRFKMLVEIGWLIKVGEKTGGRRRGATERFYRATGPVLLDTKSWTQVPRPIRSSYSWRVFEQMAEQVREAMDAGTFDSRPDRHHTWTPLVLDEQGWTQVIDAVDSTFHSLLAEEKAAGRRLERSGEEPLIATAYLAAFESPSPPTEPTDPFAY